MRNAECGMRNENRPYYLVNGPIESVILDLRMPMTGISKSNASIGQFCGLQTRSKLRDITVPQLVMHNADETQFRMA